MCVDFFGYMETTSSRNPLDHKFSLIKDIELNITLILLSSNCKVGAVSERGQSYDFSMMIENLRLIAQCEISSWKVQAVQYRCAKKERIARYKH